MLEEARKRSNKRFVKGNAEDLQFEDGSFDAVFFVTTLEFLDDYKKAINETVRVLEPRGKLVAMMLNPQSEYFESHFQKPDSYFRRIKHTNLKEIKDYISRFFNIQDEYFLGIKSQKIFNSQNKRYASLYIINGVKHEM